MLIVAYIVSMEGMQMIKQCDKCKNRTLNRICLPPAHSRLPSCLSVHSMLTCDNVTDQKFVYPFHATSCILINPRIDDNKAKALAQIRPQPFEGAHV